MHVHKSLPLALALGLAASSGCSGEKKGIMAYHHIDSIQAIATLFPKTVHDVSLKKEAIKRETQAAIDALLAIKDEARTFENTARAYDIITARFSVDAQGIGVLTYVSPNDEVRNACQQAKLELSQFAVDAFERPEFYHAFQAYLAHAGKTEKRTQEEQYFLDETMQDFVRQGLALPVEKLAEVNKIRQKLSEYAIQFQKNINDDQRSIQVSRAALAGLNDDFIAALEQAPDGTYTLGTDYPTYFEVMPHCNVSETRKQLFLAYSNRAYPQNVEVLEHIIALRDKLAKLLGFESYAHLDIDAAMAKTPDVAAAFIHELLEHASKKEAIDFKLLQQELPAGVELTAEGQLQPWDVAFAKAHYKKVKFHIDERELAQYFSLDDTISALFAIYQEFLGLRFTFHKPAGFWHPDISLIEVRKQADNSLLGHIFLDLHPRPYKYTHACLVTLINSVRYSSPQGVAAAPALGLVIANFPKPTKDKPALLKHSDVETFFHEFGHAMHLVVAQTELASLSGTNTKIDFVEMPSQMFEEWLWQPEVLTKISKHYKTGEPLPQDLIARKLALKKFDSGYFVHRQCLFSLLSLAYYLPGETKDTTKMREELYGKYPSTVRTDPADHFHASFGHLSGYASKYYSYMWSKVFALDLFSAIKERGLESAATGAQFVAEVLGRGGSEDPNRLLELFLGRPASKDAFLKDLGL